MYRYIFTFPSFYRSSQGYQRILTLMNSFQVLEISTRGFRAAWMKIRWMSCCSQLTPRFSHRWEKFSLLVHSRIRWPFFKMLKKDILKGISRHIRGKRLRIRIQQEDAFVEEVHVKLTSSPRRFQRDESLSPEFDFIFHHTLKYVQSHSLRVSHGTWFLFCSIIVI